MARRKRSGGHELRALAEGLHSAVLRLLRGLRSTDRESGVGPAQLSALSVLVMGGARTLNDLARIEDVRAPTMTRVVQGLERAGLATRRRDAQDARRVWIRASAKGQRLLHAARGRRVDELGTLLANLSARDRATLRRASQILEGMLAARAERRPRAEASARAGTTDGG